ncbi:MAG: hypothetical protein IPG90_14320 [Bacteroidetes bacterium]|nr:hypothetical protein [Bacteroidota bacterium]MBP6401335.1 hypothetical protein [Bacteroidia bacterium]MBK6839285.1 hypothetical protein [Bacteroidota bacterium]MBK9524312.1 hypothetical protein [Bacteroidota bacterium]MBK9543615.1 hypothetical protein [Bacteroidota bacterium]
MSITQKNNFNEDFKNASLSMEKRIESIGDNLLKVNSELELHQSELYLVKKGILLKAHGYYGNANILIKENLVDTFQEMEWAFVTNSLSSFCASVYRQLEIFTNHCLFEVKKCNDNVDLDATGRNPKVNSAHYINSFPGWYIYEYRTKTNKFIDFSNATDKQTFIEPYYLKTATKDRKGVLNISFPNKLNLIFGLYLNKKIANPVDGKEYHLMNNGYSELTQRIKDIRDSKEHGIPSKYSASWVTKDYLEAIKVVHELYQRIPDLK